MSKRLKSKKKKGLSESIIEHFKSLGFTNRLALGIIFVLILTIFMGFYLALKSIEYNHVSSLVCWTAAIAPLDSLLSIVLQSIVKKSLRENLSADGTGIVFASAQANNFGVEPTSVESPPI